MIALQIILVGLIIILLCGLFLLYKQIKKTKTKNQQIENENIELQAIHSELSFKVQKAQDELNILKQNVKDYQEITDTTTKSFKIYCDNLDEQYTIKEKEYDDLVSKLSDIFDKNQAQLKEDYEKISQCLSEQIQKEQEILKSIKATREAAIAAQLKEEEIKKQKDFYCLPLSQTVKNDIIILNDVKVRLTNPRILNMLIWTTFFQKNMTTLCNNVLGTKTITGIYKITNQCNDKCYIGQSVNIADRWKSHAKHGLGIDTPAGNKLYADMEKYGIWNFSWELLEECPKEELNEKEKFFINLYQSNDYGYNMTKGNK